MTLFGWVLSFVAAEFLASRLSSDLLQVLVVAFAAGAVWGLVANRRSTFWVVPVQATLAGIATGASVWFSQCSDCLVPQSASAAILGASAGLVALAGLGLAWLVHNSRELIDARMTPPRG